MWDVFVGECVHACVRVCVRACACVLTWRLLSCARKVKLAGVKSHSMLASRISQVATPVRVLALLVNIGYGRYSNEFRYDGNGDWMDGGGGGQAE